MPDIRITVPANLALAIEGLGTVASEAFYGRVMSSLTDEVQGQYRGSTMSWWSAKSKTLAFREVSPTQVMVGAERQVWFQEFGTKDSPNPILPKKPGGVLAWAAKGGDVMAGRAGTPGQMMFFHSAKHRGVPARHWVGLSIKAAWGIFQQRKLPKMIEDAVTNGG